jgi:DNA-binding beta-propeller fold protein YncE
MLGTMGQFLKVNRMQIGRNQVRRLQVLSASPAIFLLVAALVPAAAQSQWKLEKTIHVGGEGGWDYVTVDAVHHRLFVTRTTHTMILDSETGKTLGDVPGQTIAHGVAIVPKLNRGFITDGGGKGAIIVFDLNTYAVLGRLVALPDADGIIYDPATDEVLAVAGDSNALMTFKPDIDAKNGKIDDPIMLGGAPEFLAADNSGKAYVNLEDKDTVAVVDLKSRKVVNRWPVSPGGKPVGMSMDHSTHRLFIGCRNPQKMIVMNAENGKIEAALPIGAGVDATAFSDDQAFASCRDGSLTIAGEKSGTIAVEQTVKTQEGARTMGVDPQSHRIYLPIAEFEPATTGRPKAKPDTFMIVVVGQQ